MPIEKPSDSESKSANEQLASVVERANAGDKAALTKLRQILEWNPHVWQTVGDLGAIARATLISSIAGKDHLLAESLQRKAAELQQSLVGTDATQLEKLAAERVVVVWLQLQQADLECTRPDGKSIGWAGFWSRVQAQAQRRYESAIRHLQAVQRMEGHKPQRQAQAKSTDGAVAAVPPDRTADTRQNVSSAGAAAKQATLPPNTRPVDTALSDQETLDDVAAREAVVPFSRSQSAPERASGTAIHPTPR